MSGHSSLSRHGGRVENSIVVGDGTFDADGGSAANDARTICGSETPWSAGRVESSIVAGDNTFDVDVGPPANGGDWFTNVAADWFTGADWTAAVSVSESEDSVAVTVLSMLTSSACNP
jgi:hypothetical protein